jgi:hypothetical protein
LKPKKNSFPQILKILWDRREDGVWKIAGMEGVDLKPTKGAADDHYQVEDGLFTSHPRTIATIRSTLGQSIVPIVANVRGENLLRCVGTGFFISCNGLLLTAAHVITDPIERQYGKVTETSDLTWFTRQLNFGVMVPTNPVFEQAGYRFFELEWSMFLAEKRESPLPIRGVDLKLTSDIAICKVASRQDGRPHEPLTIVQPSVRGTSLAVGFPIIALGYAGMTDVELTVKDDKEIVGDYNFRLHASSGNILEQFADNFLSKRVPTPGPCFAFEARIPAGMSGGPILDREGIYVHGIVSKGWEDASGPTKFSFGSMLRPSMRLPISQMNNLTLEQLLASNDEGMPKVSAPGL